MAAVAERRSHKVFISYSRVDEKFADELRLGLEDKGYAVSIDKHSIRQGEEWMARLAKLIRGCDTVVFVLSPDSARSPICHWEVEEANAQGKRIVPVMHRGLAEPPKGQKPDGTPWPPGPVLAPMRLTLINYPRFDEGRSFMVGLFGLIEALEADHEWIEAHSRLAARARDWDEGGRASNRLMSGDDIQAAKQLAVTRKSASPQMLTVQMDFIQASEQHEAAQRSTREQELDEKRRLAEAALAESRKAEQQSRRAVRITRIGLAAVTLVMLLASGAGGIAWLQRQEALRSTELAQTERQRAERGERAAKAATLESQVTQSGLLSFAAQVILDAQGRGDAPLAMLLGLEGSPDLTSDDPLVVNRNSVAAARIELDRGLRANSELLVLPHSYQVNAVAWSPDGQRIATGAGELRLGEVRIIHAISGKESARLKYGGEVWTVAWGPDGRRVAIGLGNQVGGGEVKILDAASGNEIAQFPHDEQVSQVIWNRDGKWLATASTGGSARIYDTETARQIFQIKYQGHSPTLAWSPNGRFLAIGLGNLLTNIGQSSDGGETRIVDPTNGQEVLKFANHSYVSSIVWSRDGQKLAMGRGKHLSIVSATTGKEIAQFMHGVLDIAWSPDGRFLATGGGDKFVRIFDAATLKEITSMLHADIVSGVQWSPDGRFLSSRSKSEVSIFEPLTGVVIARHLHDEWVTAAVWSPDGKRLATGSLDKTARIYESIAAGNAKQFPIGNSIGALTWRPDGQLLIAALSDKSVRILEAETGRQVGSVSRSNQVSTVALSPERQMLATGWQNTQAFLGNAEANSGELQIFELTTGRILLQKEYDGVNAIAWSPAGKLLAIGSGPPIFGRGKVHVIDAETGKEIVRQAAHGTVRVVAWSEDGRLLAVGSLNDLTRVLDAATGEELARLPKFGASSLAFSADRRFLAVGFGKTLQIFEVATGIKTMEYSHTYGVNAISWSSDGKLLATGSGDIQSDTGEARVFLVATGIEMARFRHGGAVTRIQWNLDGTKLATASSDGTARIWSVYSTPQALVDAAKARAARCLTQKQRAQYFLPPAPPTWCVERRLWPYYGDDWQAWLPKQKAWLASGREGDAAPLPKAE